MILVDGHQLEIMKFPNGEQKIREPWIMGRQTGIKRINLILKVESDQDLTDLMFLKDYLDDTYPEFKVDLEIMRLPYSRMDKKEKGLLFTLKAVCKFINNLNFTKVVIHEPHSDVAPALLQRCEIMETTLYLLREFERANPNRINAIFYTDSTAVKRYHTSRYPSFAEYDIRDDGTGQYEIRSEDIQDITGKNIAIVDDLCDTGEEFVRAASLLKDMGAAEVYLIVTHAEKLIFSSKIFSSGLFKKVVTTNSVLDSWENVGYGELQIEELY